MNINKLFLSLAAPCFMFNLKSSKSKHKYRFSLIFDTKPTSKIMKLKISFTYNVNLSGFCYSLA